MADETHHSSTEPPRRVRDPRSYRAEDSDPKGGDDGDEKSGGGKGGGQGKSDGGGDKKDKPDKKKPIWPWIVGALVVLAFVLFVLWLILAPHARQKTDDAYVTAHFATVAPRVAGQVVAVAVNDNQPVHVGQLLVRLDDRDYLATLAQAQSSLVGDQARVVEAQAQVARQPALIRQAEAQRASAAAKLDLSNADAARYANLASTGAGTFQQHQQADTTLRQDRDALASADAQLTAQVRQLDALRATVAAASARVQVDGAQVAQAQLNLSYTRILAPLDGVVDQRQIQVGDYLTPGSPVMVVAPLQDIYVMANYRELALRHMRPGQPVRIHVDAYNIDLDGVVDSLPAASGAAYSPIPPTNATGNFTKIVQRLTVKIVFRAGQRLQNLVRIGMSVETTVDTGLEDVVGEQQTRDRRITLGR